MGQGPPERRRVEPGSGLLLWCESTVGTGGSTPQRASIKNLMASLRFYVGCHEGSGGVLVLLAVLFKNLVT